MKMALLVITLILLFAGTFGALYWWKEKNKKENKYSPTTTAEAKLATPQSQTPEGEIPLEQPESSLGVSDQVINGDSSNNLPTPEQFEVYDSVKKTDKIQYLDLKRGDGAEATDGKKVAVIYKGWLTNGTLFDESRKDKQGKIQPFVFTIGNSEVIRGWEVGIVGMKEGGVRRLAIPPSGGYGSTGQGPIPPNAVLVFDVQLLQVEK